MFIIHDALIIVHRKKIKIKLVHVYFYTLQKSQSFSMNEMHEKSYNNILSCLLSKMHIYFRMQK